jgi:DNA-binding MarR family transcriptional regulator
VTHSDLSEPPKFSEEIDMEKRTHPRPVSHGSGVVAYYDDGNKLFELTEQIYAAATEEKDGRRIVARDYHPEYSVNSKPYVVRLKRSNGPYNICTGDGTQPVSGYTYSLRLPGEKPENPGVMLSGQITPQLEASEREDTNEAVGKHGIGSRVVIQTTMIESCEEAADRFLNLMNHLVTESPTPEIPTVPYWKTEVYARFPEEYRPPVIQTMNELAELIPTDGDGVQKDTEGMLTLTSSAFNHLGFDPHRYPLTIKIYDAKYPDAAPEECQHPKLEVLMNGTGTSPQPKADRFQETQRIERAILCSVLVWSGVEPEVLKEDELSDGSEAKPFDWDHPMNVRKAIRRHNARLQHHLSDYVRTTTETKIRTLAFLTFSREGLTYDDLAGFVGTSKGNIRKHVKSLVDLGYVYRTNTRPAFVHLRTADLREKLKEWRIARYLIPPQESPTSPKEHRKMVDGLIAKTEKIEYDYYPYDDLIHPASSLDYHSRLNHEPK